MLLDQLADIVENLILIGLWNQFPEVRQRARLRRARGGTFRLLPCMLLLLLESTLETTGAIWPAEVMLLSIR